MGNLLSEINLLYNKGDLLMALGLLGILFKKLSIKILKDFSFRFGTIILRHSIIFRGVGYNFQKILYFFLLSEGLFNLNKSVDPDEMQHYATFHLGLHCLQK